MLSCVWFFAALWTVTHQAPLSVGLSRQEYCMLSSRAAMTSSRGSSQPRDQTSVSCVSCIAGGFFTTEPSGTEKAMAPHSSTLAWKIPWTEEPGRLQTMGSLRVRNDWTTSLSLSTFMHWRRKWQPTSVFLPGESQGWGSLVGGRLWGCKESDMTEQLNWTELGGSNRIINNFKSFPLFGISHLYKNSNSPKFLLEKAMAPPLQYSCLEKSHGWGSLEGYSPWGRWRSDTTERLHFHFPLSCIGEGTGNPLQCSCLENPRDGGAWWAAIYGVAQSRTWLKRLSSSSSKFLPDSFYFLLNSVSCLLTQFWSWLAPAVSVVFHMTALFSHGVCCQSYQDWYQWHHLFWGNQDLMSIFYSKCKLVWMAIMHWACSSINCCSSVSKDTSSAFNALYKI